MTWSTKRGKRHVTFLTPLKNALIAYSRFAFLLILFRQLEAEVEATWQSTSAENRQLKELFLRINPKYEIKKGDVEPYKLLFDD